MEAQPRDKIDPAPDGSFDSVFEEKSSKLVWIVPSILLHIVVITLWVMFPGKREEPKPGERKLTIRSEQAQQLKEFVEDANIRELRTELAELQGIKAAMEGIRQQKLAELKKFEVGLRSEIPDELNASIEGTLKSAALVREKDASIKKRLEELASLEKSYVPLFESGRCAEAAPTLKKAAEAWRQIQESRDEAALETERLGQIVAQLETLMQWVARPETQAAWLAFSEQCKAAIERQGKSAGEVWSLYDSYDKELNELATGIEGQELFLKELAEKERKGAADFESAKAALQAEINAADKRAQDAQSELTRLQELQKKAQDDLDALRREVSGMPSKTDAERKAKSERSAGVKEREKAVNTARKAVSDQQLLISKTAQEQGVLKKKLNGVKPWKISREDENKAAQIAKAREKLKATRCNPGAMAPALAAMEGLKAASAQFTSAVGKLPKPAVEAAKP